MEFRELREPERKKEHTHEELLAKREFLECAPKDFENDKLDLNKIIKAQLYLSVLRRIYEERSSGKGSGADSVPREYLCPISGKFMNEPVRIYSTQIFDRTSIEKLIQEKNPIPLQSNALVSTLNHYPDCLLVDSIANWCRWRLPYLVSRLYSSTSSTQDVKAAAKEIRLLTKESKEVRLVFPYLGFDDFFGMAVLYNKFRFACDLDDDLLEDLLAIFFNLSLESFYNDRWNKALVSHIMGQSLVRGTLKSKRIAAATIISLITPNDVLSSKELERYILLMRGLVRLLREPNELAVRIAGTAIWRLCLLCYGNRDMAVWFGALEVIAEQISNNMLVDELLALFVMLSKPPVIFTGEQLGGTKTARVLISILKGEGTKVVTKENCILLLLSICRSCKECRKLIRVDEHLQRIITRIVVTATGSYQTDAADILFLSGDELRVAAAS